MRMISGDRIFFLLAISMALIGLAIFSSATLGLLARENSSISKDIVLQAGLGFGLGLIALFAARTVSLAIVRRFAPYIYFCTLALTALVFVPGIGFSSGGATRWIDLGFTTFQPAELLKIGMVLAVAWWLAPRARELSNPMRGIVPFLVILGLPSVILLAQPNTSTTILLVVTGGAMYFVAGAPWRDIGVLLLGVALMLLVLFISRPYTFDRLTTFLRPTENSLSTSYQLQQSLIAIGSGGLLGRGLGQSVEKFNYLPEPEGDSIFAVFAEETGLIGALLLLGLFVALAARGIVIAGGSNELFGGLVAFGFSFMIIAQAFINIGAMLGMLPLTGLPLPFVSHGGTALLATLFMCGFVLNVAAHKKA